jgi:hypothetical protein
MVEYRLEELLDDPLVELVMKSDGVDRRCLEEMLERVAEGQLREREGCPGGEF